MTLSLVNNPMIAKTHDNSFSSMPGVVPILSDLPLPEYPYNYRWENKDFVFTVKQPNEFIISTKNRPLLQEMLSEIENLLKNEYDWDEIGYRKPTPEDINRSKDVLTAFVSVIDSEGYSLEKPHISNSEDGGAKIEWHSDKRSLYLRITRLESVITKIWDKPDRTIVDNEPFRQQDCLSLWKWIINE